MSKSSTLSDIADELLKKLPLEIRCEIEENNMRENYSTLELADIQEKISSVLKPMFPQGKRQNCQPDDTLKNLGFDRIDDLPDRSKLILVYGLKKMA